MVETVAGASCVCTSSPLSYEKQVITIWKMRGKQTYAIGGSARYDGSECAWLKILYLENGKTVLIHVRDLEDSTDVENVWVRVFKNKKIVARKIKKPCKSCNHKPPETAL